MGVFETLRKRVGFVVIILIILALWYIITENHWISSYVLPTLTSVVDSLSSVVMLSMVKDTFSETLMGFLLGSAVGFLIGVISVISSTLQRFLSIVTLALASVKKAVLVPIFVVWLGFGGQNIIIVVALTSFFPVLMNTIDGLINVNPDLIELTDTLRATWWQQFKIVRFPNALPHIFTGLKIAAPLSVIGAVVAEFIIGLSGLGYMVQLGTWIIHSEITYAAVVWMTVLGMLMLTLIQLVERGVSPWYKRSGVSA